MRYLLQLSAFAYLLILITTSAAHADNLSLGEVAPDWILPTSHNDFLSFYQDSEAQPAVLIFWATWCQHCAELLPHLNKLRQQLEPQGVKFYAINIWEDGDPVAYLNERKFDFTLLLQGDMVAKRYAVTGTPGLVVVNKNKEVQYIRNSETPPEVACNAVEQALALGKSAAAENLTPES